MRKRLFVLALLCAGGALAFTLVGGGRTKGVAPRDGGEREGPKENALGKASDEGQRPKVLARAKAPEQKEEPAEFRFPDDHGGRLVSRLLSPAEQFPRAVPAGPRPRRAPKAVESPTLPLPAATASLPRLTTAGGQRRTPPPSLLTPDAPPGGYELTVALPPGPSFAVGARLRVPSADVEQPPALPPMAVPLPDRAAAADPTLAASREAVLAAAMPERKNPAPPLRLSLPDPFENRDAVRLRAPPGEEHLPDATAPRPPRR